MSPSAVLLDLDGVLVESQGAWYATMNEVARALGAPPISRPAFLDGWGQPIEADAQVFYSGITVSELEALYTRTFIKFLELVRAEPDSARLLEICRDTRRPTAIVTNTPLALTRLIADHVHLRPDAICAPSQQDRPKPEPDLILRACEEINGDPRTACFVGDTPTDRHAAWSAKVFFVGYGIQGDRGVSSLGEVIEWLSGASESQPWHSGDRRSKQDCF